jgi:hypothetical protein
MHADLEAKAFLECLKSRKPLPPDELFKILKRRILLPPPCAFLSLPITSRWLFQELSHFTNAKIAQIMCQGVYYYSACKHFAATSPCENAESRLGYVCPKSLPPMPKPGDILPLNSKSEECPRCQARSGIKYLGQPGA